MKVVRISIWSPDYDAMTVVVPSSSIREDIGIDNFVKELSSFPADYPFFFTHETIEVESGDLQVQTFEAMSVFKLKREHDERNMAVMYYWTGDQLRLMTADGLLGQKDPSPLTVEQVSYVLKELVKHPNYKNQRLMAISKDGQMVEAHGNDDIRVISR